MSIVLMPPASSGSGEYSTGLTTVHALGMPLPLASPPFEPSRTTALEPRVDRVFGDALRLGNDEFDKHFEVDSDHEQFPHDVLDPAMANWLATDPRVKGKRFHIGDNWCGETTSPNVSADLCALDNIAERLDFAATCTNASPATYGNGRDNPRKWSDEAMATTIPVPIEFSLPEGWQAAPPDEVGAPQAAFVALRPPAARGFTPNITLSGDMWTSDVPLTEIADASLRKLAAATGEPELLRRNEVGSDTDPGLTQTVQLSVDVHGEQRTVLQLQAFIAMRDTNDPTQRVVLEAVLTAAAEQFGNDVVGDFQRFLETLRPDQGSDRDD